MTLRSLDRDALQAVTAALHGLRFGSVEIVVHDGRIVQVERREKVRVLPEPGAKER
jgi:hypothetical protein